MYHMPVTILVSIVQVSFAAPGVGRVKASSSEGLVPTIHRVSLRDRFKASRESHFAVDPVAVAPQAVLLLQGSLGPNVLA